MYHNAPLEAVRAAAATVHRHPKTRGATQSAVERLASEYQLDRVVDFVLTFRQEVASDDGPNGASVQKPMLRVALQFPDSMLGDATGVVHELDTRLHRDKRYPVYQEDLRHFREYRDTQTRKQSAASTAKPTRLTRGGAALTSSAAATSSVSNPNAPRDHTRWFVLADSTFGSCCPDEVTALHYESDCIIHFGEACMSKAVRLPVLYVHPQIRFDVVARGGDGDGDGDGEGNGKRKAVSSPSIGEVSLLAVAVERIRLAVWRRKEDWNARQKGSDGSPRVRIQPRLVVVGTPSAMALLEQVKCTLGHPEEGCRDGGDAVSIDWCSFSEGQTSDCRATVVWKAAAAVTTTTGQTGSTEEAGEEAWTVNGAHFPRLGSFQGTDLGDGSVEVAVQHFLFVGPSTASHPIHLHGAHQYNNYHYPPRARDYFDEDNRRDSCDAAGNSTYAPAVFVVDEQFAVSGAVEPHGEPSQPRQGKLPADATREEARAFLRAAFQGERGDAVVSAMEGTTAQSTHALAAFRRRLQRRSFNIEVIRGSSAVGILVASLAIEGYYECTMLLHRLLRAYGKRSYIVYVGHLNEFKIANFGDTVDCFVAVACPNARHCHFPERSDNYVRCVVSPAEVLLALAAAPGDDGDAAEEHRLYGMPGLYSTEFMCILEPLRAALAQRQEALPAAATAAAAADGVERRGGDGQDTRRTLELECTGGSLVGMVRSEGNGSGALTATSDTVRGSLARLYQREYVGLDPRIGQTEVQERIVPGKHGIARGYASERQAQGDA